MSSGRGGVLPFAGATSLLLLLSGCAAAPSPSSPSPTTVTSRTAGVATPVGEQSQRDLTVTAATTSPRTQPPIGPSPVPSAGAGASPMRATPRATPRQAASAPPSIGSPLILSGPTGPVKELTWSPDGTRFATASGAGNSPDNTVRLWRADGTPLATLEGHTAPVRALAWSPDGRLLASGAADYTVRLWSAAGTLRATIDLPPGDSVFSLAWSPDGARLAIGSIAFNRGQPGVLPGVVRIAQPGGQVRATLAPTISTGGKFLHLAWSPDGQFLAAGAIEFRLWRPDGTLVATFGSSTPSPAMAWSPDGKWLAAGNENGLVTIIAPRGQRVADVEVRGPVASLAFSPDGSLLAINTDSAVLLASATELQAQPRAIYRQGVFEPPGPTGAPPGWSVSNLAWSPDGGQLVGTTRDHVLRLWRADGAPLAVYEGCPGAIERVVWSPNGQVLIAGSGDKVVCLWRGT